MSWRIHGIFGVGARLRNGERQKLTLDRAESYNSAAVDTLLANGEVNAWLARF